MGEVRRGGAGAQLLISMMDSHGAPSKAILWIWHMSGKSFSLPAAFMQVITSWVRLG